MTPETIERTAVWLGIAIGCGFFWTIVIYMLTGNQGVSSCIGASGFLATLVFAGWLCQGNEKNDPVGEEWNRTKE